MNNKYSIYHYSVKFLNENAKKLKKNAKIEVRMVCMTTLFILLYCFLLFSNYEIDTQYF
jgi:hypothetical protein